MKRDDYFKMGDLIEVYRDLLTRKQKNFLELYYFNNYSIEEIAQLKKITRQGVYDLLKRTERRLQNYEDKLGLLKIKSKLSYSKEVISGLENLKNSFLEKIDGGCRTDFEILIEGLKKKVKTYSNV